MLANGDRSKSNPLLDVRYHLSASLMVEDQIFYRASVCGHQHPDLQIDNED